MPPDTKHRAETQHRLEVRRARLVRELAAINAKLRRRDTSDNDDEWDYDPRVVEAA